MAKTAEGVTSGWRLFASRYRPKTVLAERKDDRHDDDDHHRGADHDAPVAAAPGQPVANAAAPGATIASLGAGDAGAGRRMGAALVVSVQQLRSPMGWR